MASESNISINRERSAFPICSMVKVMTPYLLDGYPDTFVSVAGRYHGVDELL